MVLIQLVQSSVQLLYKLSRRHQGLCSECFEHVRQQLGGGLLPYAHLNVQSSPHLSVDTGLSAICSMVAAESLQMILCLADDLMPCS